ncbi:hypothetical protein ACIA8C_09490 [Nocardia sp. NPDC051321]
MAQSRTRAKDPDDEPVEQQPLAPDSPNIMSRAEIEDYRAKLRSKYHEP